MTGKVFLLSKMFTAFCNSMSLSEEHPKKTDKIKIKRSLFCI